MRNLKTNLASVLGIMLVTSCVAFADTTSFTPLNFDNTTPTPIVSSTDSAITIQKGPVMLAPGQVVGGTKMQDSIVQIDNAQLEVRNQLLNYRTEYTQIDSKFQTTKAERKSAKKKIKQAEKRIKNLEKAKKQIRKNFEQKNNI